jgi:hypothetical protein
MTEQIMIKESVPKSKMASIIRQVLLWTVLALVLFTCFMAAYRKFGG